MTGKPKPTHLLVLVLAGGLLGVVMLEVALRVAQLGYNHSPFESDPVLHHVHPRNYEFRSYIPSGEFGGHLIRYDQNGFRVDPYQERESDRSGGARIAVVGDSFIEALQVAFDETAASVLGEFCPEAVVTSFGVSSYSPALYSLLWDVEIAAFEPTHVVLVLFENDPVDDERYYAEGRFDSDGNLAAVPGPKRSIWFSLGRQSYLLRLVRRTYQTWVFASGDGNPDSGSSSVELTDLTRTLLRKFASQVESSGAEFILAVVPPRASVVGPHGRSESRLPAQIRELSDRESWRYVDLETPFQAAAATPSPALYFTTDFHWTAAGNRLAARTLASGLGKATCSVTEKRDGSPSHS